jgi:hypothetical protein
MEAELEDSSDDEPRRDNQLVVILAAVVAASEIVFPPSLTPHPHFAPNEPGGLDLEWLLSGNCHEKRFREAFRMNHATFLRLVEVLRPHMRRLERKISIEYRIAIVLHYFAHPDSQRGEEEELHHSGSTFSDTLHEVVEAIVAELRRVGWASPASPDATVSSPKFRFFEGCLGALDCLHVKMARAPLGGAAAWRNRHDVLSQNVFISVSFEMLVTFCLAGMEGSSDDGTVKEFAEQSGFRVPPGCFYLGDAGFGLTRGCLTPYRGVRYHLKEWETAERRPQNREELFNLRHAQLRSLVERLIGMNRWKWAIIRNPLPFRDIEFQKKIIVSVLFLWNFILANESLSEEDNYDHEEGVPDIEHLENNNFRDGDAEEWRDGLAQSMWDDYQIYLHHHARRH